MENLVHSTTKTKSNLTPKTAITMARAEEMYSQAIENNLADRMPTHVAILRASRWMMTKVIPQMNGEGSEFSLIVAARVVSAQKQLRAIELQIQADRTPQAKPRLTAPVVKAATPSLTVEAINACMQECTQATRSRVSLELITRVGTDPRLNVQARKLLFTAIEKQLVSEFGAHKARQWVERNAARHLPESARPLPKPSFVRPSTPKVESAPAPRHAGPKVIETKDPITELNRQIKAIKQEYNETLTVDQINELWVKIVTMDAARTQLIREQSERAAVAKEARIERAKASAKASAFIDSSMIETRGDAKRKHKAKQAQAGKKKGDQPKSKQNGGNKQK